MPSLRPVPTPCFYVERTSVQLTARLHLLQGGNTSPLLRAIWVPQQSPEYIPDCVARWPVLGISHLNAHDLPPSASIRLLDSLTARRITSGLLPASPWEAGLLHRFGVPFRTYALLLYHIYGISVSFAAYSVVIGW